MAHSMLPSFPFFDARATDANNVGTEWLKWVKRFENFIVACGITADARKTALLLHYVGEEVYDIYCSLPDSPAAATASTVSSTDGSSNATPLYTAARKKLDGYFAPRVNPTFEIYRFRQAKQMENESLDAFYARLRQLVKHCAFADADTEIKNQILLSTVSTRLRRYAMQHDLDLQGILKQGRLFEEVEHNISVIEQECQQYKENSASTLAVNSKRTSRPHQPKYHGKAPSRPREPPRHQRTDATCYNCGKSWPHSEGCSSCPGLGKQCNACRKLGHFASVCRSTRKTVHAVVRESSPDSDEHVFMTSSHCRPITASPQVDLKLDGETVRFTIDTGATVSVIGSNSLKKRLSTETLSKTSKKVFAYGANSPLPLLGKLDVLITYKNSSSHETVYVVSGDCTPLLSFSAASRLGLVQITYSVGGVPNRLDPRVAYPDLFKGVGCLKDFQVHLHVDPLVQPLAQPHRRIPFSMRKPLEEDLERLQSLGIIEKTEEPTPWVSPIVAVPKPHDPEHIRMCVDMRCANQAIQPAEVFQDTIRQVLTNIPNVLNVSDDILAYGKTEKEHDEALKATLECLLASGLTLNVKKCKFYQQELTFFGHVFSNKGVQPDPTKVSAVIGASPPTSASEVKSLLGLVNYCGWFIPNLAHLTQPLRKLAAKGEDWCWTDIQQDALDELKRKLSEATALAYFDPGKDITLIVDAAPHGLGAILTQTSGSETRVVAYGSRALSPVEARYSQIEREMLAVVWGIEHFHIYLYGTAFHLLTDHKPLVSILSNPRSLPSARLERLALRIQQYTFEVQHTSGPSNPSGYLSRHPVNSTEPFRRMESVAEQYVNFIVSHSLPRAMTMKEVTEATLADPVINSLKQALKQPQKGKHWKNTTLQPFSRVATELSVSKEGLVLRGTRIVLPAQLHTKAVHLAHRGHKGIVKTKQLLREKVWFPGIDSLVDQTVKSCLACQTNTPVHHRDPLPIQELPQGPWTELSLDFAGPFPDGKYAMVVVDDFSKYPVSEGFAEFASELGFKNHRITPRWPEANGEAERFMRTLKKSILASRVSHLDWTNELQSFLLAYRSTPHGSTGKSPFELLFGRPMRNLLPTLAADTQNLAHSEARQNDTRRKAYNKQYVDSQRHTSHNQLHVGQQVICKQDRSNKFSSYHDPHPYTITKVTGSKITASRDGVSICRNSSFFKDASTVQMERHQDQPDMPDLDDAAVPSNCDPPSHRTATPGEAPPATTKTASQRYPQRTRQRPERLKDYV
ncbi:uncharacterized protein LOC125945132 [Dermacentor silvarum]|uniref:uncharacterized protein LOC125945132 n=1 Tax=Dermacentor silvarum TaxID=543639 RepID=UPI002101C814|nr:uncharacterized protein LOC125945132 [Dermacentor silvarum]